MIVSPPYATTDEIAIALAAFFAAGEAGVRFRLEDDQLQFGPSSAVTPELRGRLTEPSTKRIIAAIVAGDQAVADVILANAIWQAGLFLVDLPNETVAALRRGRAVLERRPDDDASDEYRLLMQPEDCRYIQVKPQRGLPPCVPGTWLLDAWPPSERRVPFGRHKGETLGAVAASYDGREYLKWIVANGAGDPDFRADVRRTLGDAGVETAPEPQMNEEPEATERPS